jgi:hypothetical protein
MGAWLNDRRRGALHACVQKRICFPRHNGRDDLVIGEEHGQSWTTGDAKLRDATYITLEK